MTEAKQRSENSKEPELLAVALFLLKRFNEKAEGLWNIMDVSMMFSF